MKSCEKPNSEARSFSDRDQIILAIVSENLLKRFHKYEFSQFGLSY
jgi:hypothetical protein